VGQGRDDAIFERGPSGFFDQVDQSLRVRLGPEFVAGLLQLGAQRVGILDDAVVDESDVAVAIGVRMGVGTGGSAVCGPAGVGDSTLPADRLGVQQLVQPGDASRQLPEHNAASILHRHARGVVAAVLKAMQPFNENRRRFADAGIAYDAAHRVSSSPETGPWKRQAPMSRKTLQVWGHKPGAGTAQPGRTSFFSSASSATSYPAR